MADIVEDIIGSESFFRGWVDPVAAKKAYRSYVDGSKQTSFFIWQWINLELWLALSLMIKSIILQSESIF